MKIRLSARGLLSSRCLILIGMLFIVTSLSVVHGNEPETAITNPPIAKDGILDLTKWDFRKDGPIELKGEWRFVWNELVDAAPINQLRKNYKQILPIPLGWKSAQDPSRESVADKGIGYGTYMLMIKVGPQFSDIDTDLAVRFREATSAAHFEIWDDKARNRLTKLTLGDPATKAAAENPLWVDKLAPVTTTASKNIMVIIKVSNFYHARGGVQVTPQLGLAKDLHLELISSLMTSVFLIGALVIISLYHLVLYTQRREDLASLGFCMYCGAMAIRETVMARLFQHFGIGHSLSGFETIIMIEYLTMPLSIIVIGFFIKNIVRGRTIELPYKFFMIPLGIILAIFTLTEDTHTITDYVSIYQFHLLTSSILIIIHLLYKSFKKNKVAQWVSAGFLIFFIGGVNDILYTWNVIDTGFYVPYAFMGFILLQSAIISGRFAKAFDHVKHLVDKLKEQEHARTLFFQNTSHELRTPLNGIIGFLDLVRLNRYGEIPPKAGDQIDKAMSLAKALKLQINTILDLAKAKRGELQQTAQKISLCELKIESDNLAEGLKLRQEGMSYSSSLNASENNFIGDKEKIFTIIRNLLGNAFKFKEPGRDNIVNLELKISDDYLNIIVEDTGCGIPATSIDKIFEEFGQVDGDARRSYEGTGLGLSMVHNLVHLMHGDVVCRSEEGKGSVFEVKIPQLKEEDLTIVEETRDITDDLALEPIDETPSENSTIDPDLNIDPTAGKDLEVFIIDDTPINCEVITDILHIDGYRLRHALSGAQGIEQMREKRPNLLLLDMMMPEMSGEDVIQAMKKDPLLLDIPIILITARASEEDRIFGLNLGADDYLAKPIVASELRLKVHNMIDRHNQLREIEQSSGQDKVVQLGELFGDLSHELKNILGGSTSLKGITTEDSGFSASILKLGQQNHEAIAQAMITSSHRVDETERMQELEPGPADEYKKIRRRIRRNLARMDLSMEQLKSLWEETKTKDPQKLSYFDSQMRLFKQHHDLKLNMDRCQELTQSVLSYTRNDPNEQIANLNDRMDIVRSMIQAKERNTGACWDVKLEDQKVAIQPNALTQVILNLSINALDAIANLPKEDQWITTHSKIGDSSIEIEWTNGGQPISRAIQNNLFNRGFSTKGDKGSGIGLYVSRRIAKEAGGDLIYVSEAKHPCFRLVLKLADHATNDSVQAA